MKTCVPSAWALCSLLLCSEQLAAQALPLADQALVTPPVESSLAAATDAGAVQSEWIMVVTRDERARLDSEAEELLSYLAGSKLFTLTGDGEMLMFRVPLELDANDAVLKLVPESMRDLIDRNHVYDAQ